MRIRTVKPEFWSHPIMGRLDDATQLLALALLNHADDHGYFHADVAIVRGACAPFREDLATISRSLAKLSEVGWIVLGSSPEHGQIGYIKNWTKHQRVDHPKPSKIEGYFPRENFAKPREDLANDRDKLALDQGAGNRDQVSREGEQVTPPSPQASPVVLPPPQKATNPGRELLDILRTNGCKMELGAAKLLPEWFEAAGDLPLEWVAYVIKKRKAKLPSDLRKGLKELEQEFGYWKATRKGTTGP